MKHCFLKIFTPIIIAAGITACSVTELSGVPRPQLDGGYTCKCEVTAGIIPPGSDSNEECEFAFSGTVKRLGKGFWEMDITAPDTIAGMKLTSCDGDLSSSLGELSMGVSAENVSDKSPVSALFTALDKIALDLEKMQTQCDKYQVTFTKTATANKKLRKKNSQLKESLENAQEKSVLKKLQDNQLRKDYEAAVSTLDRIPQEVLELYMNGNQKRREKPIEKVL